MVILYNRIVGLNSPRKNIKKQFLVSCVNYRTADQGEKRCPVDVHTGYIRLKTLLEDKQRNI